MSKLIIILDVPGVIDRTLNDPHEVFDYIIENDEIDRHGSSTATVRFVSAEWEES